MTVSNKPFPKKATPAPAATASANYAAAAGIKPSKKLRSADSFDDDDDPFTTHTKQRFGSSSVSGATPATPDAKAPTRTCSVYGCGQKRTSKGYCATHAKDPNAPVKKQAHTSLEGVVSHKCKDFTHFYLFSAPVLNMYV